MAIKQQICVQGLGFVGAAMAIAIANAIDKEGAPLYDVVGLDLPSREGNLRIKSINNGEFPFPTTDASLERSLKKARQQGNLLATDDTVHLRKADIVVVDIPLDIAFEQENPALKFSDFEDAISTLGKNMKSGSLIIVETTAPPGTCEKIVKPRLQKELEGRDLPLDAIGLAYSFERVMPGANYLASITKFWRVYAGIDEKSADRCESFLSSIIDVEEFPLTRVSSLTAAETTKVLENTYRAANIAFIDEWTRYAEAIGVDLFEILDAIRVRPTHSNIRFPGLGVGGYCLTKDPAFAPAAADQLFGQESLDFPFSSLTRKINREMPLHTSSRVVSLMDGDVSERRILILGASYRPDVGDVRFSPTRDLALCLKKLRADVSIYDPLVGSWPGLDIPILKELPDASEFNAAVIAVAQPLFRQLNFPKWANRPGFVVVDATNLATKEDRDKCRQQGVIFESIGRGNGL